MNATPRQTGRRPNPAPSAQPPLPEVEPLLSTQRTARETGPGLLEQQLHVQPEVQAAVDLQRGPGNGAIRKFLQLQPPAVVAGLLRGLPLPHLDPEEDRLQPFVTEEFAYVKPILAEDFKTAEAYASLIRRTFGSYRSYYEFAKESDAECEKVRYALDKQPTLTAQTIFYRWVRWEYIKRGLDPVKTISMKMSAELSARITAAKAELLSESGSTLKVQGFNPRPEKAPLGKGGGYRFGTLSEHAQGNAVDIDPDHNLFVSNDTWNYILAQPNITKPKGDLTLHRWITDPEGMYEDLAAVSDTWRDEARRRFEVEKRVRQAAGSLVSQLREPVAEELGGSRPGMRELPPTPILGIHAAEQRKGKKVSHAYLQTEREEVACAALAHAPGMSNADKLASIGTGLMTLPREVVLKLRAKGLVWGATFRRPGKDIQHFEFPDKAHALPDWPAGH
jgi:hypothetical protein